MFMEYEKVRIAKEEYIPRNKATRKNNRFHRSLEGVQV
jgi:hypothetical protein